MKEEPTSFGLSPEKVARILRIGSDGHGTDQASYSESNTAELLRDRLAQSFPSARPFGLPVPWLSVLPCLPTVLLPRETIGDLLQGPQTPMSLLKRLKQHGKDLFSKAESEPQRDVGLTIYYAAIANALVFHGVLITRFDYAGLRRPLATLADKEWMFPELRVLFAKARNYCVAKKSHARGSGGLGM
jgi:hypothetical protein